MKPLQFLLLITLLLFYPSLKLSAQTENDILKGVVYKGYNGNQNKGFTGVIVKAEGVTSTDTDLDGEFSLRFVGKRAGAPVKLSISKGGYKVINELELITRIPDKADDRIAFYMCPENDWVDQKEKYYAAKANLNLDKKYARLERRIRNANLSVRKRQAKLDSLSQEKEAAEVQISLLAGKLAEMDLSANTDSINYAFSLYQAGFVDSALQVLRPTPILNRISQRLDSVRRLQEFNEVEVNALLRASDMALTDRNLSLAEDYLRKVSGSGVRDFSSLKALCQYLINQKRAEELGSYIIELQERASSKEELAQSYQIEGKYLTGKQEFRNAMRAYEKALSIREELIEKDTTGLASEMAIKALKAETLTDMGIAHYRLKEYDDAQRKHTEALVIRKDLADVSQQKYSDDLAESYNYLGVVYGRKRVSINRAVDNYEKALKINQDRFEQDSANQTVRLNLSFAYSNLSVCYRIRNQRKDFKAIKDYAVKALVLREELAEENLPRFGGDYLWSLTDIVRFLKGRGKHDEAIEYFEKKVKLLGELYEAIPAKYKTELVESYSSFLKYLDTQKQYEAANIHYANAVKLYESLAVEDAGEYTPKLSELSFRLGEIKSRLGDFHGAVDYFGKSLVVRQKLAEDEPITYNNLVKDTREKLEEVQEKLARQERRESREEKPLTNQEVLAQKLREVGELYLDAKAQEKATNAYQGALDIYQLLAQESPGKYEADIKEMKDKITQIQASLQ
ncbi:MAG: tetratricopeptide repeat protein [Bacteroidota bacterium]